MARDMRQMLAKTDQRLTRLERKQIRRGQRGMPGDVAFTAAATAPEGALLMRGQSLLRADYPRLFARIGTTYGAVDGAHFNIPNAQGRTLVSLSTGGGTFGTLGATPGAQTVALSAAELPNLNAASAGAHSHGGSTGSTSITGNQYPGTANTASGPTRGSGAGTAVAFSGTAHTHSISSDGAHTHVVNAGGGAAHNNIQPSLVLNAYIWT